MRNLRNLAATILAMSLMAACGGATEPSATDDSTNTEQAQTDGEEATSGPSESLQLTIGSIFATTGDLGTYGPPMNRAAEMAVDYVNDALSEAGIDAEVSFVAEDSESRAEGAVAAARKVISEGASCIMGPLTTPESVAVLNGATLQRDMTLVPLASASALRDTEDQGTIFRVIPPDNLQGQALAIAVEDFLGTVEGKKVAFAHQNSSYGEGLRESFGEAWESRGGEIALTVNYSADQQSYESEAQQLTAEDYDAYVFVDFPETFGKLGDALLRTGNFDPTKAFVADALAVSPIPEAISPEVLEGARGVQGGSVSGSPHQDAFAELSNEVLGEDQRGSFDALVFDGVMLCTLSALAAESTEPAAITEQMRTVANSPGERVTFLDLAEAASVLGEGGDIDYDGTSGEVEFGEDGDNLAAIFEQFRFVDGELEVEETIEVG